MLAICANYGKENGKMNNVLIVILILDSFVLNMFYVQQVSSAVGRNAGSTEKRPSLYISFERAGERKPVYAQESNQGVWLRLHNDTRWGVKFCTESLYIGTKVTPFSLSDGRNALGLRDGIEVNMCHGVEQIDHFRSYKTPNGKMVMNELVKVANLPVGYNRGDVFSTAWLPPGHSIVFSVPREHLAKYLGVYIKFNYEWECDERTCRSDEPEHRVYFRAADLPPNLTEK